MRLVADEGVAGPTVAELRAAGHTVLFIAETSPGIEDSEVLAMARREQEHLLATGKNFGELAFRNRESRWGVLLIHRTASKWPAPRQAVTPAFDRRVTRPTTPQATLPRPDPKQAGRRNVTYFAG